jgi:hypothetical protein
MGDVRLGLSSFFVLRFGRGSPVLGVARQFKLKVEVEGGGPGDVADGTDRSVRPPRGEQDAPPTIVLAKHGGDIRGYIRRAPASG